MDTEKIQHLASNHYHNRKSDHKESSSTKHVVKVCVLEMTYQAAIIDEEKDEYQNVRVDLAREYRPQLALIMQPQP